jgi:hypothetical protein
LRLDRGGIPWLESAGSCDAARETAMPSLQCVVVRRFDLLRTLRSALTRRGHHVQLHFSGLLVKAIFLNL